MGAGGLSVAFLSEITDPVETFAIVMCILLIAPLIFERFKIPGMIGLITAGIVVGPHGLGLLSMGEIFTLFRNVGLVYLMFLAGLEINLRQFGRQKNASMIFGSFTFFIPQVGGTLLARWLFDFPWPTSILLASMFASHTLVPFPIVQKLGLSKNRAVTTTVGGTILTDTAAMLVLAVVAKSTEGDLGSLFFLRMGGLLGVFVAVTLIALPRLGQWFFREVEPDGPTEFAFVLAACFVVSAAAHWAGVEPIIGAFLAGLALSAYVPENSVLMSRLQFTGHALFIPFFLLAVGMLVDLSVLFTGLKGWAVAIFMSVTVTATKWAAARISGKLLNMTRDEAGLIFSLSVNQAAATLAAVLVGHRLDLFGDDVMNGTILMILITCMIGPWLTDRYGRRISLRQPLDAEAPAPGKETPDRILLPMDYERSVSPLMDFALLLRRQDEHEPLYPLNVSNEDSESRVAAAERILAPAVLRAVSADAPVQAVTRIDANTASGILRAVRELRISTVIMGWSGQSAARNLVFHSVPDHIIEQSHQTVFMCRLTGALNTVQRVVVLAPPLIERQPGLPELLRSIRHMAGQISARVLLVAGSATVRHLKPRFKERPRVDVETLEIVEWQGLVSGLRLIVQPEDELLLLSVRRARLAWQPTLERLPRELAGAFPKNNLVVAYAAEPDMGDLPAVASSDSETEPLTPGVQVLGLAAAQTDPDLPERLRSLVAKRFGEGDPAEHVVQEILKIDPVELAPGAALLHAHIPDIAASEVHIGAGRKGIPVSGTDQPVRVLFVLLSGAEQPASAHLRALAGVAALARMPKIVDRLAEAETDEQARAILTDPGENAGT